ncbi:MAG: acyl-CoA dehydratase activase-related protein [Bacilli bacterium]
MVIGIPRSLFYYRYQTLIRTFFKELDIDYVISDSSTKKTLEEGKKLAPDEACISLKLFLGHINNLKDKCDYIFIPRIESVKKEEKVCTNFYLLYDLVNNLFDMNILDINIDETHSKSVKSAFIELGLFLGFSYNKTVNAYKKAKEKEKKVKNNLLLKQTNILMNKNKKVLLVGHPYNIYDELVGKPIINFLEKNGIDVVYADIYDDKDIEKDAQTISSDVYFTFNKELIGGIAKYKDNVDGIILVTSFPCGPDSLINELIIRKVKDKPIINIITDESNSDTGLLTRLESFIDIINKEKAYE